jgi:hypothetical protein
MISRFFEEHALRVIVTQINLHKIISNSPHDDHVIYKITKCGNAAPSTPFSVVAIEGCDSSPRSRFFICSSTHFRLWAWPRPRMTSPASPPPNGGRGRRRCKWRTPPLLQSPVTSPVGRRWVVRWVAGVEVNRWMINKVTASAGVVCGVRTTTRRSRDVSLVCFFFLGAVTTCDLLVDL